jgi:hypothetical protein
MRFTAASACIVAFGLTIGGSMAQTDQQKVSPGNEPTKAVGSQVEPMKGNCADKTASTTEQHPPTTAVGDQVPKMTAQNDCTDRKTQTK